MDFLLEAIKAAKPSDDGRVFFIGAVGIRSDGAVVRSRNGPRGTCTKNLTADGHAEARLIRKLGPGADVYVARVRADGSVGMARPCPQCLSLLRSRHVRSVTWTENDGTHNTMSL